MKIIKAKKITKKNFSKFGQLIDTSKRNPININDGYAKRFDNLINVDAVSYTHLRAHETS